jgi:hypothetical protein
MSAARARRDRQLSRDAIERAVTGAVRSARVFDLHTHLYDGRFGPLLLRGIDELLTYHYLIAEVTRATGIDPKRF